MFCCSKCKVYQAVCFVLFVNDVEILNYLCKYHGCHLLFYVSYFVKLYTLYYIYTLRVL